MTRLRLVLLLASAVLAAILLALLFILTGLDLAAVERSLLGVRPQAFAEITLLLGFNNFLAGEKWRLIALSLHRENDREMPRLLYFAFTSIGVALGQIAPAPITLMATRSIGAHVYGGRALVRGAAATLWDYFFDLVVAGLLALCSAVVLIAGGGARSWAACAFAIGIAGVFLYGAGARLTTATARWVGSRGRGRVYS